MNNQKIVVRGSGGVGKTAHPVQWHPIHIQRNFPEEISERCEAHLAEPTINLSVAPLLRSL
jgi:hypothetical protein